MSNINHNNPSHFIQGSSSIFTYAPLISSNETLDPPRIHLDYHGMHEDQMQAHVHGERRESNPNPMYPPRPLLPPSSNKIEAAVVVNHRECQKNHAASMGAYIVDGCGEFIPKGEEGTPEGLICAACECHRSFHRREMTSESQSITRIPAVRNPPPLAAATAQPPYQQHHHRYNLAPIELSGDDLGMFQARGGEPLKKRFRTKFTEEQKQNMHDFAEKLGWGGRFKSKMHKKFYNSAMKLESLKKCLKYGCITVNKPRRNKIKIQISSIKIEEDIIFFFNLKNEHIGLSVHIIGDGHIIASKISVKINYYL